MDATGGPNRRTVEAHARTHARRDSSAPPVRLGIRRAGDLSELGRRLTRQIGDGDSLE